MKARGRSDVNALADPSVDPAALEKSRIKGAVRTDFVLSAEILVIALGIVAQAPFMTRVSVLVLIAVLITVGVYGLVAGTVKLDDLGLYLSQRSGKSVNQATGRGILTLAPYLMKCLAIVGTAAMFLVGGGILAHGLPGFETWLHHLTERFGTTLELLIPMLLKAGLGIVAGALALAVVSVIQRLAKGARHAGA